MSKRWEILQSTSMRLALAYAGLFIASSLILVGLLWWRTTDYLDREIDAVILSDTQAVGDQLRNFGLRGAVEAVNRRAGINGDKNAIYMLADPALKPLGGNMAAWPVEVDRASGWYHTEMVHNGELRATRLLNVDLPGRFKLLVGRDVQDRAAVQTLILHGLGWATLAALVLAAFGGMLARRTMLARVEGIGRTAAAIVQGDLTHRLAVRGSKDEFDQLAGTINQMLEQIVQLIEGVRNVSNTVAHDLRTPLAELRVRLEDVLRHRPTPNETFAAVGDAVEDVDRLIDISNALLRLAEIDSGVRRSGFRKVDLSAVVLEVADLYRPSADAKKIAFVIDTPADLSVNGDPSLLAQAVGNLVDNAVKYAPADGGKITLSLKQDGAEIMIAVADNGPGIPDADKARVTERFYRGDSSRGAPGVGLGLSVVASVAKLHGGRIVLTDNQPGLIVSLVLPLPLSTPNEGLAQP